MKKILPSVFIALLLDQIVKLIVINNMTVYSSINIINNFLNITYVRNTGAAWSILSGNRLFLIFISLIALVAIYFYFIKNKKLTKFDNISYGLLIGGIVGNLTDRIIYGYVIDYLDFKIINYDFPIFNIADICIVVSVILIGINMIVGEYNAKNNSR